MRGKNRCLFSFRSSFFVSLSSHFLLSFSPLPYSILVLLFSSSLSSLLQLVRRKREGKKVHEERTLSVLPSSSSIQERILNFKSADTSTSFRRFFLFHIIYFLFISMALFLTFLSLFLPFSRPKLEIAERICNEKGERNVQNSVSCLLSLPFLSFLSFNFSLLSGITFFYHSSSIFHQIPCQQPFFLSLYFFYSLLCIFLLFPLFFSSI